MQVADKYATINVVANDHDTNGHLLELISFESTSARGVAVSRHGENLVYRPRGDFVGVDSFT